MNKDIIKTNSVHLKGADSIAKVFGVSRGTVLRWVKTGAPIYIVGKKYQANYEELWHWISNEYSS